MSKTKKNFKNGITFGAGTTAAGTAPINLTSGAALTTEEDGAIEYHSSHLYFTIGSTRHQIDQQTSTQATISALDIDWSVAAQYRYKSITGDSTFTFSSLADKTIVVVIISDTSSHNVTFPSGILWGNTGAVVLANCRNVYTFMRVNGDIIGNAVIDIA